MLGNNYSPHGVLHVAWQRPMADIVKHIKRVGGQGHTVVIQRDQVILGDEMMQMQTRGANVYELPAEFMSRPPSAIRRSLTASFAHLQKMKPRRFDDTPTPQQLSLDLDPLLCP